jgi:hypothetical protein
VCAKMVFWRYSTVSFQDALITNLGASERFEVTVTSIFSSCASVVCRLVVVSAVSERLASALVPFWIEEVVACFVWPDMSEKVVGNSQGRKVVDNGYMSRLV